MKYTATVTINIENLVNCHWCLERELNINISIEVFSFNHYKSEFASLESGAVLH